MVSSHCIGTVYIVNRDALRERLTGAVVRIGPLNYPDRHNNTACGTITLALINFSQKIEFNCQLEGQFLTIEIPGVGGSLHWLHVCEVEAFEGNCEGEN